MNINKKERGDLSVAVIVAVIVLIVAGIAFAIGWSRYWSFNDHTVTFTINQAQRVTSSGGNSSQYLIFTTAGVFTDSDSVWRDKWNSSDLFNQLTAGKSYKCDAVGYRNGFFSTYQNLLSCTEIKA